MRLERRLDQRQSGALDGELLDTSVVRHGSGLRVLAQSGKAEEAESVRAADLVPMLEFLRRHYSYLVIDGGLSL